MPDFKIDAVRGETQLVVRFVKPSESLAEYPDAPAHGNATLTPIVLNEDGTWKFLTDTTPRRPSGQGAEELRVNGSFPAGGFGRPAELIDQKTET